MADFFVAGIPVPQGSKRHVGNGVMVEQGGERLRYWREAVRSTCWAEMRGDALDGAVAVLVEFYMPRPKNHYRRNGELKPDAPVWHTQRPDVDKLLRSTLDGLTSGGAFADDCVVALLLAQKRYANGPVGARIQVLMARADASTDRPSPLSAGVA